ncbi:MAG: TonB-dependent siderophore receptor, partial [Comamonadaceae bacterium]
YGQGSAGGMLNLVSKRPTAEPVREIQLQVGTDARKQVAGDVSGAIDDEGKLLYRVTGLARDAQLHLASLPDDRFFIAPALTWKPSADTSLTVLSHVLRSRSGTTWQGYPIQGTLLPNPNGPIPLSTFLGEPGLNHFNQDQWMVGYLFEHRLGTQWTFRQNARYGRMDQSYLDIQSFGGFQVVNPGNPSDPANFRLRVRGFNRTKEDARTLSIDNQAEARITAGDWRHTVLVGIDHQRTRYGTETYGGGAVPPIDVYAPVHGAPTTFPNLLLASSDIRLDQTGIYAQDQVKFGDRWVATIGGRLDRATADRTNRLTGAARKHSDDKFSGRAGLVYLHPSGLAPYVSYAESFSPSTTVDPATNDLFDPEIGSQSELGLRYQPPGSRNSYTVSVYNLKRRNYVTYDFSVTPFVPRQTGEITVQGLEIEALFQPMPALNVVAGFSHTPKADVTRSSSPGEVGKQYLPVSRNQASVWADYRFAGGLKIGVGARYVGSNNGILEMAPVPVPGYTLVDALVGYDIDRWSLALNVRNLANKRYIGLCDPGHCYYGDPRQVTATATYRF